MKLINLDHSPYATRVRILIYKKNLPIEIVPPPLALRTPEFLAQYPLGKVPVLELDDGSSLPESTVILDYLEDTCGGLALRPDEPLARAQMQLLARVADTHLGPEALFPIFRAVMSPGETDWQAHRDALHAQLSKLDHLLASFPACTQRSLHLGDITLVPTLHYVVALAPVLSLNNVLGDFPNVETWWQWVQSDAAVKKASDELQLAFEAFSKKK
jgi:glutathione S-transferase